MSDLPPIEGMLQDPPLIARLEGETLLDYTNRIRLLTVEELVKTRVPDDPKEIYALNTLLDSIDKQEINKAKIEADKENTASDRMALELITGVLAAVGNTNPFEVSAPVERTLEHEGPVIEGVTLVENELDTKQTATNYDSFMAEYKRKNPKPTTDD